MNKYKTIVDEIDIQYLTDEIGNLHLHEEVQSAI